MQKLTKAQVQGTFRSFLRTRLSARGWEGYAPPEFWETRGVCNEFLEDHGWTASWASFARTPWGYAGWGYGGKTACYLQIAARSLPKEKEPTNV